MGTQNDLKNNKTASSQPEESTSADGAASTDGNLRSLPPADYQTLALVTAPASYICVVRDPETKAYRIEATPHPKTLIDNIFREADLKYGVELITILATDDLAASEARLYKRHGATLGSDWLRFDQYQITEFDRSLLMVKAYRSHYVMSESQQALKDRNQARPTQNANVGRYWSGYHRRSRAAAWDEDIEPRYSDEYGRFLSIITSRKFEIGWKVAFIVFILLVTIARCSKPSYRPLDRSPSEAERRTVQPVVPASRPVVKYFVKAPTDVRYCMQKECNVIGTLDAGEEVYVMKWSENVTVSAVERWLLIEYKDKTFGYIPAEVVRAELVATPSLPAESDTNAIGITYYVNDRNNSALVPIRDCPQTSCEIIGMLFPGKQIQALRQVNGSRVHGSTKWIRFNYDKKTAYIHSAFARPQLTYGGFFVVRSNLAQF